MSQTPRNPTTANKPEALLKVSELTKHFGSVKALTGVTLEVDRGEVHCLLGDNGAGKSTLIKTLAGVYKPTTGSLFFRGKKANFGSPRDAMSQGIGTVYQDLAVIPLMSVLRNFFLGHESEITSGLFRRLNWTKAEKVLRQETQRLGFEVRDPSQPAGTLSGGERQTLAIARAVYFGAELLILDEPTSALGVAQKSQVLRQIDTLRKQNLAIILITHNVRDAYAVGDRFTILERGQSMGTYKKNEISRDELQEKMAGGKELVSF